MWQNNTLTISKYTPDILGSPYQLNCISNWVHLTFHFMKIVYGGCIESQSLVLYLLNIMLTIEMCVCTFLSVCMFRLEEQLDEFVQFFLEVLG